jgi:cation diffusion facilitator CzcD-associated flavoprotein CzcO
VQTTTGPLTAQVVVAAMGGLSSPKMPKLDGMGSFGGVAFHSARWRDDCDLRDARVAVVGTGASAIQIVPELARVARAVDVYQRTPPWIMPHPDRARRRVERTVYRRAPVVQRALRGASYWGRELVVVGFRHPRLLGALERIARRHLRRQVSDGELRAALTPAYRLGCKRVLLSNDYYPALAQPHVTLIRQPVAALTPTGVLAGDGSERPADVVVFATGFEVTNAPGLRRIRGRDGRTLAAQWNGRPEAYNGTMVTGFPNFLMLLGPHTGLGHSSVLVMIEAQIAYLLDFLATLERRDIGSLEVRPEAQTAFVEWVRRRARGTVWEQGGCASWYLDADGHTVLWPDFTWRFRRRLRRFDLGSYEARPSRPSCGELQFAADDS